MSKYLRCKQHIKASHPLGSGHWDTQEGGGLMD